MNNPFDERAEKSFNEIFSKDIDDLTFACPEVKTLPHDAAYLMVHTHPEIGKYPVVAEIVKNKLI